MTGWCTDVGRQTSAATRVRRVEAAAIGGAVPDDTVTEVEAASERLVRSQERR